MKIFHSHPWNVSLEEAKKIQERLNKFIIKEDRFQKIRVVGGVGINFGPSSLVISIAKFTYPDLKKLDLVSERYPLLFPYTPGFFAFSCGAEILSILEKTSLLDLPTIACSKRALTQNYPEPEKTKGSYEYIFEDKEKVGLVLRSRDYSKPIFISPGNKISINSSLKIVLHCCTNYRLPEPLRQAQLFVRKELQHF